MMISARTGDGLDELWAAVEDHHETTLAAGELETRRRDQQLRWMWHLIEDRLLGAFRSDHGVTTLLRETEEEVLAGTITPTVGAARLLAAFGANGPPTSD